MLPISIAYAPLSPASWNAARPSLFCTQAGVAVLAGERFGKLALTMWGVGERDRLVAAFAQQAGLPLVVTFGGGYARDINMIVEAHCQTVEIARVCPG